MCKPTTRALTIPADGPCNFSIRSYASVCGAFSLGWSWRASLANVLRTWADRAEKSHSLVIVAHGPPQIAFDDVIDAATIGFTGATKYLNDLWRDRVFHPAEETVAPIVPVKTIS